jgi:hypothetical protein
MHASNPGLFFGYAKQSSEADLLEVHPESELQRTGRADRKDARTQPNQVRTVSCLQAWFRSWYR